MFARKLSGRKQSSFCEQKEAKKLCHLGVLRNLDGVLQLDKSFLLLFFKKMLLPFHFYVAFLSALQNTNRVFMSSCVAFVSVVQQGRGTGDQLHGYDTSRAMLVRHQMVPAQVEDEVDPLLRLAASYKDGRRAVILGPDVGLMCGLMRVGYQQVLELWLGESASQAPCGVGSRQSRYVRTDGRSAGALDRCVGVGANPIPLKAALAELGFGDGRMRLPLTRATPATVARLSDVLPQVMTAEAQMLRRAQYFLAG